MNEQISKILEQAKAECFRRDSKPLTVIGCDELEKFAELIVRECVEVVKWTPSMFPNDTVIKNIKEHFGVEE